MDVKLYKANKSLMVVMPFYASIEQGRHIAILDKKLERMFVVGRASDLEFIGTKSLTVAGELARKGFVQYGKDPGVFTPPFAVMGFSADLSEEPAEKTPMRKLRKR